MLRFDNRLRDKEEIVELISVVWSRSDTTTMETKIRHCHSELTYWTREQNQNSAKIIKEAQIALETAVSDPCIIGDYTSILE